MSFLPEDFNVEDKSSGYLKLEKGDNRVRILGAPIVFMEGWTTVDGKPSPVRFKKGEEPVGIDYNINKFTNKPARPKQVLAFPVLSYHKDKEGEIKVWAVSQVSIQEAIQACVTNPKWGDPYTYDFVVNRSEGDKTEYSVIPEPKEELSKHFFEEAKTINLEALITGDNPFEFFKKTKVASIVEDSAKEVFTEKKSS